MKGGGVEKVLLNMIKALPKDKYEITVMAILDEGERKKKNYLQISIINMYGNEHFI